MKQLSVYVRICCLLLLFLWGCSGSAESAIETEKVSPLRGSWIYSHNDTSIQLDFVEDECTMIYKPDASLELAAQANTHFLFISELIEVNLEWTTIVLRTSDETSTVFTQLKEIIPTATVNEPIHVTVAQVRTLTFPDPLPWDGFMYQLQETGLQFKMKWATPDSEDMLDRVFTNTSDEINYPYLSFDQLTHDFGQIFQGDKVTHTFSFCNKGTQPLEILDLQPSCGCTVPRLSETKYDSDECGEIQVQFNAGRFEGAIRKTVLITTNDPFHPELRISITGDVQPLVLINPPFLFWGEIQVGKVETLIQTVTLHESIREGFQIDDVETPDYVTVERGEQEGDSFQLQFTLDTQTAWDSQHLGEDVNHFFLRFPIEIVTNHNTLKEIYIPCTATLQLP